MESNDAVSSGGSKITDFAREHSSRKRKRRSNLWLSQPKRRRLTEHQKSSLRSTDPSWTPIRSPCSSEINSECGKSLRTTDPMWTPMENVNTVYPGSDNLKAAPIKHRKKDVSPRSKKQLFDTDPLAVLQKEIVNILPSILSNLEAAGKHVEFCQFLRLIATDKFPLNNISFLLLLDVAKWYSLHNTSQMNYTTETMKFWKTLYRLFHGKALRFMGGDKSSRSNITNDCTTKHTTIDPHDTAINFAVPSVIVLNNFKTTDIGIPKEINPGIIDQGITLRSKNKNYVLSVDGKKLAPGLNKDHGDQDLFGHEQTESLKMRNERLEKEITSIETVNERWQDMHEDERYENLKDIIKIISVRIEDMRKLFLKQTFALKKFQKEAGDNWRTSKFVYAISSVQAQIYQIRSVIKKLLLVNDKILEIGSSLRISNAISTTYSSDSIIDVCAQENSIRLKDNTEMPTTERGHPRFVKQRSDEWFDNRKKYRLTGSTLYAALGLDTLKKQQKHFDRVVKGVDIQETFPEDVQKRLDHGTKSEINAIATLLSKFLPFYYPHLKYIEEGAHEIIINEERFMLVSPDGSLCSLETNSECIPLPLLGCEFKCPFEAVYTTPVHYEMPIRYIPQVLAEMASMEVETLIYLCWTDESSTVFRARFDAELWDMIWREMKTVFHGSGLKRPTRLSNTSKVIADKLKGYREQSTEFLCGIPSVKGQISGMSQTNMKSPYLFPIISLPDTESNSPEIDMAMSTASSTVKEVHEICRRKATEVLVWLLSDTDRNWDPEIPHATPVAYAMPGYSLPVKPMRDMHEHVLQSCYENGMNVVCSSFDGQWIRLSNRDINDRPLTLLQLQRDIHVQASKANRKDIVKALKDMPITENIEENIQYDRNNFIAVVSCSKLDRLMKTIKGCSKDESKKRDNRGEEETFDIENLSCLPDDALETLITVELPVTNQVSVHDSSNDHDNVEINQDTSENSRSSAPHVNSTTHEYILTESELRTVLTSFQTSDKKAVAKRWAGKTVNDLQTYITKIDKLNTLTHAELNSFIDVSGPQQKSKGILIRRSWSLVAKVNALSKVIGSSDQITKEKTVKHMKSLKEFASNAVDKNRKNVSKQKLNNVYASMLYDVEYKKWLESSPFAEEMNLDEVGSSSIFSFPEQNDRRQKLEHRCLDYHHLFVNLRVKVCKDGLYGIRKEAWHRVAEVDGNIISKAIVCDLIDKQNNAYAKRTFSAKVESAMRSLNYENEADFCKLIREWYQAEDMPGLSAVERCKRRLALKDYLLHGVDFSLFPLPGMYIKGFPKVMYEGFLQRIDTTFQLYSSMACYNPRSISSLVNETFFGELSELEPTKLGCPKAVSIPRLISVVTEMQHYRCDPTSRNFKIITKRKSVYPATELQVTKTQNTGCEHSADKNEIKVFDHSFDMPERRRKKQRKSKRSDVSRPSAVSRGCQPIRFHHKCDESRILPTTRLGLDLDELKL